MKVATGSYDINWGESSLFNNLFRGVAGKGACVDVYCREKIPSGEGVSFHQVTPPKIIQSSDTLTRFYFNLAFYRNARRGGFDLIHGLCFNAYPCHRLKTPYILDDIVYPTYIEFIKTEVPKLGKAAYLKTLASILPFTKTVKLECENADAIIVPNEFQKQRIIESFTVDEDKVRIIPYGIRKPERNEAGEHEREGKLKIILFTGNDYLRKGLHYLIEAMSDVVKKHPESILLVVGGQVEGYARSKPTIDYMTKLIKHNDLSKNIFFKGQLSFAETQKYMGLCDVFCLPTLSDSCSRAVLEAISHGKPVVTTPNSGYPEIDEVGIKVPEKDSKAISDALNKLIEDDKLRNKKKQNCMKASNKYSWDKVTSKYARLYEKVLENQPG
ncbi:MAG: glycosyltransferase family 4 protein [Candidatus Altiarchaeota archaeon]